VPGVRDNLASLVDDFELHARDIAVVSPRGLRQQRITYGELATLSRRFAAELEKRGILKGDRVLILGENCAEWVAAFFGCVLRGVIPVPVDFSSSAEFVQRVTAEVTPKLIAGDVRSGFAFEDFASSLSEERADAIKDLSGNDALQIIFTSGTTGQPKGVVHTHRNVLASLEPIEREIQKNLRYERWFHPIRILHTLPLSHVFGQFMGLWIPALLAAELHFEPRLVAGELVEKIHGDKISVLAAVPRVLDLLQRYLIEHFPNLGLRVERAGPLQAWRRWWEFRDVHRLFGFKFWALVCGGAALAPASEQFWKRLGFVVVQGYGMTETTALVSLNHPFRTAQGTVGQVLPGREVRLGADGEVLVRGETISSTVWQNGAPRERDSEWLATGDLGEFDAQGNLRFRGRKKDVIVTSAGLNIYPEDLEAALNLQAEVRASAVIEADGTDGPEALAVLAMNAGRDPQIAVDEANRKLAEFQQIRRWLVWPEADLPRTSTGKVLKREVAARIAAGEVTETPGALDGNLDSLGRVQLQAQLEQQYGVSLDDDTLQNARTQEDIQRAVAQAPAATPVSQHRYPRWVWNPVMQMVRGAFLECAAMPLVRLLAKPRVKAKAKIAARPVLIVCNHITAYDAAFVLYALPGKLRRHVTIAMSGEMILDMRRGRNQGSWFLNLLAPAGYLLMTGLFNVFPLPQLSGFRRSFQYAGEAMDRGYSVLVFPEGRRSDDGAMQAFMKGSGLLWKELGAGALPVYIDGLGEMKAHKQRWFRSGKISISAGETLMLDKSRTPEELTEQLRRAVMEQHAKP
jgi:long-chain acyl-CoA synthetase